MQADLLTASPVSSGVSAWRGTTLMGILVWCESEALMSGCVRRPRAWDGGRADDGSCRRRSHPRYRR